MVEVKSQRQCDDIIRIEATNCSAGTIIQGQLGPANLRQNLLLTSACMLQETLWSFVLDAMGPFEMAVSGHAKRSSPTCA